MNSNSNDDNNNNSSSNNNSSNKSNSNNNKSNNNSNNSSSNNNSGNNNKSNNNSSSSVESGKGGEGSNGSSNSNSSSSSNSSSNSEMLTVLVLGKAGNGKSSLCNALLGEQKFPVGRGMAATTVTAQSVTTFRGQGMLQVVDTPDVTNCRMDAQRRQEEVDKWRQMTLPFPTVALLTVRCDVRYTAEEFAIYREIMDLWGNNYLKERLVVAFTFGDRQDNDLEDELRTVCPELKSVLRDADNHYVMFTNKGSAHETEAQVQRLLTLVERGHKSSMTKLLTLALGLLSFIAGLCFVPYRIANKARSTILFVLKCLVAVVWAVVLWIKEKMR